MAVDEKAIPVQGTDIGRALDEASRAMEQDARRKLLILVTDGEDLERGGIERARELGKTGVIIYTVGVGTREGKSLPETQRGAPDFVRDAKGSVVNSHLDEETLRSIAAVTGGTYQPLGVLGQGLIRLRETLKTVSGEVRGLDRQSFGVDRFYCFIAAGLLLIVLESIVGTRRRMSENSTA